MSRQNNYVAPKKGSLCDIYLTAESFNLYFSFYHGIYYWRVGVQTSIITKIIYKKKSTLTVLGPNTFNYKWVRSANNKTTDLKTSTTQKQQTSTYKIAEFINPPTHTHTLLIHVTREKINHCRIMYSLVMDATWLQNWKCSRTGFLEIGNHFFKCSHFTQNCLNRTTVLQKCLLNGELIKWYAFRCNFI